MIRQWKKLNVSKSFVKKIIDNCLLTFILRKVDQ